MQKIHLKNAFYVDLQIKLQLHFLEAQNWEYKPKQCIMLESKTKPFRKNKNIDHMVIHRTKILSIIAWSTNKSQIDHIMIPLLSNSKN
jgi:hypothetical protein